MVKKSHSPEQIINKLREADRFPSLRVVWMKGRKNTAVGTIEGY
ncbi:hypothetical protein ACFLW8_01105 [Chloroflexota bacterium]